MMRMITKEFQDYGKSSRREKDPLRRIGEANIRKSFNHKMVFKSKALLRAFPRLEKT